ncbi:MAG: hypothetical protein Q8P10_01470 [bacterium]|nr:hypothetical protein [bacterium]
MTATGHAVIGTVIAAKIGNPALAVPIALASHIAADMIPHWDLATNGGRKKGKRLIVESALDVFLGFILSFVLVNLFFPKTDLLYVFFIVLIAQSFDWLMVPYYFLNIDLPPFNWAYRLQKKFDRELDKPWGIVTQTVLASVILLIGMII